MGRKPISRYYFKDQTGSCLRLTRFFKNKNDVSQPAPPSYRVKESAFFPYFNAATNRHETSALNSTSLASHLVLEAATTLLSGKAKGAIEFSADNLGQFNLNFQKDGINHAEHGNILGWPALDGDISNIASDLAKKVTAASDTIVTKYSQNSGSFDPNPS